MCIRDRAGNGRRHRRVKRGNLYPEQHQIGMRAAFGSRRAAPSKHAGRWLQRLSNDPRRGMIARQGNLAYRIRPIDPSCIGFLIGAGPPAGFFQARPPAIWRGTPANPWQAGWVKQCKGIVSRHFLRSTFR